MTHTSKKGFTLIELLIVIAIIAILATAVILLLNPAELLKQARDSQRISDLDTIRTALALYLSTTGSNLGGAAGSCYYYTTPVAPAANCGGRHAGRASLAVNSRATSGAGWVFGPDMGAIPGGSPLSVLPVDPRNNAAGNNSLFYSYATDGVSFFELDADMESSRYASGGTDDTESNTVDGGNSAGVREVGNAPNLAY